MSKTKMMLHALKLLAVLLGFTASMLGRPLVSTQCWILAVYLSVEAHHAH